MLLDVEHARKYFPVVKGLLLAKTVGHVRAVDDVSFSLAQGETFGLVGESGCGKTTVAKCILMLEKLTSGRIRVSGRDIAELKRKEHRDYRRKVGAVFQDPYSSLNPRMRTRDIIAEPLRLNGLMPRRAIIERVLEVLELVGLSPDMGSRFPHEFSGGQRQRIAVARALGPSPALLVLDEPISALDVSIRAQIMNLLSDLQQRLGLAYLIIAHDLAVVRHISTNVGVMYLGKIVEQATSDELYENPLHPYAKALIAAATPSEPGMPGDELVLSGEVPSPLSPPPGCHFHPRCPYAMRKCSQAEPALVEVSPGHKVACFLHSDEVVQPTETAGASEPQGDGAATDPHIATRAATVAPMPAPISPVSPPAHPPPARRGRALPVLSVPPRLPAPPSAISSEQLTV